jgi:hypothetical protein
VEVTGGCDVDVTGGCEVDVTGGCDVVVGGCVVGVTEPLQVVPLSLKVVGSALVPE